MYYLYCYTSPSGKKYVGITDCISRRQQEHAKKERGDKKNCTKFAQAIRKYGYKNFTFEVIGKSKDRETIEEFERYYIEIFDSINNGYNIVDGGKYGKSYKKFSKEVLLEIDSILQQNLMSYSEINEKYGISIAMLSKIKNRTAWADILGDKVERANKYKKGSAVGTSKLTEEQVLEIRKLAESGMSRKELRDKFGVSKSLIQAIITRTSWSHI